MLLTHATIAVRGDRDQLLVFDARVQQLIITDPMDGECTPHHGDDALCYDLKLRGGIPFPVFAQASAEFPELTIHAEWVNVGAGTRGAASLIGGGLTEHTADRIDSYAASAQPAHVRVAADGRLLLAMTCMQTDHDEWHGYCLHHARDALFRLKRDGDSVVLFATEGSPEWSRRWVTDRDSLQCDRADPAAPIAIEKSQFTELDRLAQTFAAEWIWFASAPPGDIAIEKDRYQRYGYAIHDANVRTLRLHQIKQDGVQDNGVLDYCTLATDQRWISNIITRCWLGAQ